MSEVARPAQFSSGTTHLHADVRRGVSTAKRPKGPCQMHGPFKSHCRVAVLVVTAEYLGESASSEVDAFVAQLVKDVVTSI